MRAAGPNGSPASPRSPSARRRRHRDDDVRRRAEPVRLPRHQADQVASTPRYTPVHALAGTDVRAACQWNRPPARDRAAIAKNVDHMIEMTTQAVVGYRPLHRIGLVVFPEFAWCAPMYDRPRSCSTTGARGSERAHRQARAQGEGARRADPGRQPDRARPPVAGARVQHDAADRARRHPLALPQSESLDPVGGAREPGRRAGYRDPLFPVVETEIGRLGVATCYDWLFPEVTRELALNGAEVLIRISAYMDPWGATAPMDWWTVVNRCRAIENVAYVVAANQGASLENYPPFSWPGGSMVVDFDGRILAQADPGPGEKIVIAPLDLAALRSARRERQLHNFLAHRRRGRLPGVARGEASAARPTPRVTRSRASPRGSRRRRSVSGTELGRTENDGLGNALKDAGLPGPPALAGPTSIAASVRRRLAGPPALAGPTRFATDRATSSRLKPAVRGCLLRCSSSSSPAAARRQAPGLPPLPAKTFTDSEYLAAFNRGVNELEQHRFLEAANTFDELDAFAAHPRRTVDQPRLGAAQPRRRGRPPALPRRHRSARPRSIRRRRSPTSSAASCSCTSGSSKKRRRTSAKPSSTLPTIPRRSTASPRSWRRRTCPPAIALLEKAIEGETHLSSAYYSLMGLKRRAGQAERGRLDAGLPGVRSREHRQQDEHRLHRDGPSRRGGARSPDRGGEPAGVARGDRDRGAGNSSRSQESRLAWSTWAEARP